MFDYDGVIMNSNHCPMIFYEKLAQRLGTKKFASWEECRAILEANFELSLKRLGVLDKKKLNIATKLYHEHAELWKNLALFPNIKEILIQLKNMDYKLAIVSNNHNDIMIPDLKKNNVFDLFDHVIDNSIGYKPEITQIIHCLKLTGTNPDEAVLIDDMDGGIIAAKNAKLKKAIGVSYGYQLPHRLHMADVIVDTPEEILDVVE